MGTSKMQVAGASGQAAKRTPPSSERAHRTQLLGKALTRARVVSTLFAINHWMLNWFVASMTSEADMENAALTYSTLCYRLWHWYIRARRTAWKQWRAYARRDRACNAALRELIPQVRSLRDELPRRLDLPVLDLSPEDEAIVNALRDTATKAAADREALEALVREIVRVTENSDLQRCMVDNLRSLYEYQLRTQNEYHAMVIKCLHERIDVLESAQAPMRAQATDAIAKLKNKERLDRNAFSAEAVTTRALERAIRNAGNHASCEALARAIDMNLVDALHDEIAKGIQRKDKEGAKIRAQLAGVLGRTPHTAW